MSSLYEAGLLTAWKLTWFKTDARFRSYFVAIVR